MINLVNGYPQGPNNLIVPNGSISFQLNVDATVVASPGGFVCADIPVVFQFDGNGVLVQPAKLWSNQELNPQNSNGLGTYYLVTFYDQNGARLNTSPMWWQFPQTINTTVDISSVAPYMTEGNVIFYPTSFPIIPPTLSTLGGVFANAGAAHKWVSTINTDGTVTLAQPAFTDISGSITNAQLPSPFVFTTLTASGLITAQANIELGVIGTTSGQIALDGSTSGQAFITAPAVAGTATNPILVSNSLTLAATCILSAPGGVTIAGTTITAQSGTGGTVAMTASPTFTGTVIVAAATASGLITANAGILASETLSITAQPTLRLTDSELTSSFAGSTNIGGGTGSIAAVRGAITQSAGNTLASGFEYGIQGKLVLAGTLANGSGFNAGIFGQLDTSAAGFAHTSGYLAPIMGDFGATAHLATDANANMVALLNTTNCIINAAVLFIGNASYAFDLTDLAFGGAHFVATQTGITTLSKSLKVRVDGVDYFIPLCTGNT